MKADRRTFVAGLAGLALARPILAAPPRPRAVTVRGPVDASEMGVTLVHEHVLVDFVGAAEVGRHRYDADEAFRVVLPHLRALKERGATTLVECTPAWLGRDPRLLVRLSEASGLHIVTNTGYYGAAQDKYLPAHAFEESAERLASRWTAEWRDGIEGTGIRPGFIKTGVDPGPLSDVDRKLIVAAARCHGETGLRIHCHTGDGRAAMDILSVLEAQRVSAAAFVWVHAQNEKDHSFHRRAAQAGAWVEFDGISAGSAAWHRECLQFMSAEKLLDRTLVSQDSGWYHVGEAGGGNYRGYGFVYTGFVPTLEPAWAQKLLVENPVAAFGR